MILLLTHLHDDSAIRLSGALRRAGSDCVVATVESLSFAAHRRHRVHDAGVHTLVELAGGVVVDSDEIDGVINRVCSPPDLAWRHASTEEYQYATSELQAFMLSWLSGLQCPVRNRPDAQCLAGPSPHPTVAFVEAARCGLSQPPERPTERMRRMRVTYLDGVPYVAQPPTAVVEATGELLRRLDADRALVGVDYAVDGSSWVFLGMTPLPEIPDDADLVRHLQQVLDPSLVGAS
jgi:hypothetical protein